jgi:hypothetical protein
VSAVLMKLLLIEVGDLLVNDLKIFVHLYPMLQLHCNIATVVEQIFVHFQMSSQKKSANFLSAAKFLLRPAKS